MATELPEPAVVRAGCAQQVITPPTGVSLAGYFHDRVSKSVRDDLYARAIVIESGGARAALVSLDLVCVTQEVADAAKRIILAEAGVSPNHVLIGATHTHTGPEIRENAVVPRSAEYVEKLPGLVAGAVKAAAQDMFPATLRAGKADAAGYSYNRLFRLRDGSEVFGKGGHEDDAIGPAGPNDPALQTLSVVAENGELRALAVNFAMHPDVIGGGSADFISADWPGEMCRALAAVYGPATVPIFLQGTCGDINHRPHDPTHLPTGGPKKAVQLGRGLAGVAVHAAERAEPMAAVPIRACIRALSIPYYTRDDAFRAEIGRLKAKEDPDPFEKYIVERGESWLHDGQDAEVPVQAIRIGDVGIVGMPAEIFARLGLEIKHWSPAPATFVVELANARVSNYVPTTDQAERGAYGAKPILCRWLCADAGRRMADAAQVMLRELWA